MGEFEILTFEILTKRYLMISLVFNNFYENCISPGPGCSKLTMSLVNVLLKFQTLITQTRQYFLLKKCEKLLQCKSFSHFFIKKYQCLRLQSHKTLYELTS